MVTSNADGCPADQLGKYMSTGLELLSGIKFFCSQTGDKFVVEQAANIGKKGKNCFLIGLFLIGFLLGTEQSLRSLKWDVKINVIIFDNRTQRKEKKNLAELISRSVFIDQCQVTWATDA